VAGVAGVAGQLAKPRYLPTTPTRAGNFQPASIKTTAPPPQPPMAPEKVTSSAEYPGTLWRLSDGLKYLSQLEENHLTISEALASPQAPSWQKAVDRACALKYKVYEWVERSSTLSGWCMKKRKNPPVPETIQSKAHGARIHRNRLA